MSFAEIASIAAPIIGGLFGKKKQPAQKWITPNYGEIRNKAEAAGFNPLTALQSASGGVGSAGSSGFNFGDAVASGLSSYAQYDQQQTQLDLEQTALDQRERELELRERQFGKPIASALPISPRAKSVKAPAAPAVVSQGAAPSGFSGDGLPYVTAAESVGSTEAQDMRSDYLQNTDRPADFTLFGKEFHGSGLFNNADRYSQEGGEPAEWIMSPFVMADAVGATLGREANHIARNRLFDWRYERDRYEGRSDVVRKRFDADKKNKKSDSDLRKVFDGVSPVQLKFRNNWK